MSTELEEKKEKLEALRIEVRDLEKKERSEKGYPKMQELVGTYWKYRSSYSGSREKPESWWLYRYIKEVRPDGFFVTLEFQEDIHGIIRIDDNKMIPWESPFNILGGESNSQEWGDALAKVRAAVRILGTAGE